MILGINEPNANRSFLRNPLFNTAGAELKGVRYQRCSWHGAKPRQAGGGGCSAGSGCSPGPSGGLHGEAVLLSTERRAAGRFWELWKLFRATARHQLGLWKPQRSPAHRPAPGTRRGSLSPNKHSPQRCLATLALPCRIHACCRQRFVIFRLAAWDGTAAQTQ